MASRPPTSSSGSGESLNGREAPSLLPGELLGGKYRIEAHLAEGGMGVVLRATHLDLDSPVAIKLLRPEHSHNEDVVARLLAEAKIAASLRSKHVNRVLDVGRTQSGVPYLVLEYLEGSDLGGYLERRGPLPVAEAADYVLQACEALAEAHAIGIVHRDMKPENLFLAEEADGAFLLKVLDFGISKAPASRLGRTLTNPFEVVGSPTYMSPEQVRGGNVDARTDVWALGAVLYELCTGDIFFDEESLTTTFKRVLDPNDMPPPLAGGDEAAQMHAVIVRCLEREPARRFQDMVELARALEPLGRDALQASRVAKVASAARARFIAVASERGGPLVGTPFALTTSHVERALGPEERRLTPTRRYRAWSIAAAAAVAAVVSGAQHWKQDDPLPSALAPSVATPTALAPPATTERDLGPAERAVTAHTARSVGAAPTPLLPPQLFGKPPARPVAGLTATPKTAPATTTLLLAPEPSGRPESHEPAAASGGAVTVQHDASKAAEEPMAHLQADDAPTDTTTANQASFDAWDPKTFGGRK